MDRKIVLKKIKKVNEDDEKVREALHSTITIIDVSYFTNCNIKIFCDALQSNSLTKLSITGTYLPDEQMFALSNALKSNLTLKSLCLGADSIGAEGARALSNSLKSNSTLSELNLHSNSIAWQVITLQFLPYLKIHWQTRSVNS